MADDKLFGEDEVCNIFGIDKLNDFQRSAIKNVVMKRQDTFVNLPTGFGKSLIYQSVTPLWKFLNPGSAPIVIVVSPLVNLMKDQVDYLNFVGLKSISLSEISSEKERISVERGEFSLVYGSPEAWLTRWRKMLTNSVYATNIIAVAIDEAHVISHWGTSKSSKQAAFRECFSKLNELRSLVPTSTPFIALTATATQETKETILSSLLMKKHVKICESPDKPNVTFSVQYMEKSDDVDCYLQWIVKELTEVGIDCQRIIIYCQTIRQTQLLYSTLRAKLGNKIFHGEGRDPKKRMVEMLHACSPKANKEHILNSFKDEKGIVRVLVATIAFGMGIDCKGVHIVVHYGPSKNIEAYVQECGRAGRDGQPSKVFLLYNGLQLIHVDKDIKGYLKTKQCRRKYILNMFNCETSHEQNHKCCDVCADTCNCEMPDCKTFTKYPTMSHSEKYIPSNTRNVSLEQKQKVKCELISYAKQLLTELLGKIKGKGFDSFATPQFMMGFSTLQIQQVLDNCKNLFTLNDISHFVEIWDVKHAYKIQATLMNVFCDIKEIEFIESLDQSDINDDEDEQWKQCIDFLGDDDLVEVLMCESLNLSGQLDLTIDETVDFDTSHSSIPVSAVEAIENMNLNDEIDF